MLYSLHVILKILFFCKDARDYEMQYLTDNINKVFAIDTWDKTLNTAQDANT